MHIFRGTIPQNRNPVALTIGNFDGMHLGHQTMLRYLRESADRLDLVSCVMIFEPHPREFLSPNQAPVRLNSLREKLEFFSELGINQVQICRFNSKFAEISPKDFMGRILQGRLLARWILAGKDFRFGANRVGDLDMLKTFSVQYGFEVHEMPSYVINSLRVSSTAVRQALAIGNLEFVKCLLGRPYSISGRVIDGDKLGKKIGYATANIQLKREQPPISGIFVVEICGAIELSPQIVMRGVASLGARPTVHKNSELVLEVHIFDFKKDIYGLHLRVNFLHKLRDEEKYPNLEMLARQIGKDVENAKNYFSSEARSTEN